MAPRGMWMSYHRGVRVMGKGRDKSARKGRVVPEVIDSIGDGVVLLHQGNIAFANAELLRMLGYSWDEIEGTQFSGLLTSQSAELVSERDKRVVSGEDVPPIFELDLLIIDGGELPVEAKAVRVDYEGRPSDLLTMRDISERQLQHGDEPCRGLGVTRDISDRERAEEALRESEEKFRTIFENANDEIIYLDEFGTVIDVNNRVEDIFGYKREELVGKNFTDFDFVGPEALQDLIGQFSGALSGDTPSLSTFEATRKDGSTVSVELSGRLIQLGDEARGLLVIVRDISDRKRAEEALHHSERYFRSLIENSTDAVYVLGIDGAIQYESPSVEHLYGYRQGEQVGKNPFEFVHPEDVPEVIEFINNVLANPDMAMSIECRTRSPEGGWHWVESVARNLLDDPAVKGVVVNSRDTDERRRAEEIIRESEEKFRMIFDNASDAIVYMNSDGMVVDVNSRIEDFTGYSRDELVMTDLAKLDLFAPGELERMVQLFTEALEGKVTELLEVQLRHKDGHVVTLEVSTRPVEKIGEADGGFLTIVRDVSERKSAEESLARYAAELARSNTDLEQFAYVASHDLQEPLRMVQSYVQLLARRYKGKLDSDADDFIYYAVDGVTRMHELIEGLLAYSRVSTRGKEFEAIECEVVLDRVLANLQIAVEDSGAVVTHDPLPRVIADELQLTQVFQNLIANAIKFRGEESPRVHVSAEEREKEWVFSVRDNGIGFEPEHAERIFVIFQRLHCEEEYAGTGIGLALCRKIVERHGGHIWVESQPEAGSTFYFSIPFRK
jgi:PAS domain S-box-containing protein